MWKLLKALATIVLATVVAVAALAWLRFDRATQTAAEARLRTLPEATRWSGPATRLWPPAAVLVDLSVPGPRGVDTLRCPRAVLPVPPWVWIRPSPPAVRVEDCEGRLDLPDDGPVGWLPFLTGAPLGEGWTARGGRLRIAVGSGPSAPVLDARDLRLDRPRAGGLLLQARLAAPGSALRWAVGAPDGGRATGRAEVGPLDAATWSALLVDPAEARVLGGRIRIEADLRVEGMRLGIAGTVVTESVLVEGRGAPGPVIAALRRGEGAARFPFEVEGRLDRGADWTGMVRRSVRASAR